MTKPIGFIGLGAMGVPMALRLVEKGTEIVVWARSSAGTEPFKDTAAHVADSVDELFEKCEKVILMLANSKAIDAVLDRGTNKFSVFCKDRTIIHMGTTAPAYSKALEADIIQTGGRYAEIPVSGSSVPAAKGELVAMMAGNPSTLNNIKDVIAPMISSEIYCGPVPTALQMKLAVNTYLSGLMTGLAEATNLAKMCGLDMEVFRSVLEAGPMNNAVMRMKLPKLINEDFSVQASVYQALNNQQMMLAAGAEVGAAMPMVETARSLQMQAAELGCSKMDLTAILKSYAKRNQN